MRKETADLVAFTEEILNGKLHFLCSVNDAYWKQHSLKNHAGCKFMLKYYITVCIPTI